MQDFAGLSVKKGSGKKIPLYHQVETLIRNRILNWQMKPGEKLHTEENLMRQFGVSRITVRKALANLEMEGLVARNPAKGTFVADNIEHQEKFVINNTIKNILVDAARYKVKVVMIKNVKIDKTRNPKEIGEFLGVADDDEICVIKRVRYLRDEPVCYLENYLPVEVGEQLTHRELSRSMLLEAVKEKTCQVIDRGEMYISAIPAEPGEASHLGLQVFEPLILRQIYYWFHDNRPFEMVWYFMKPNHFRYKANMVVKDAY